MSATVRMLPATLAAYTLSPTYRPELDEWDEDYSIPCAVCGSPDVNDIDDPHRFAVAVRAGHDLAAPGPLCPACVAAYVPPRTASALRHWQCAADVLGMALVNSGFSPNAERALDDVLGEGAP